MSAIPLPSLWRPPSFAPVADDRARSASWWTRHLRGLRDRLTVFTAGKEQRNPTTGKAKRNVGNGKTKNNTDTDTACCCTPPVLCAGCAAADLPESFSGSASGVDLSCAPSCHTNAGIFGTGAKVDIDPGAANGTFTWELINPDDDFFPVTTSGGGTCVWRADVGVDATISYFFFGGCLEIPTPPDTYPADFVRWYLTCQVVETSPGSGVFVHQWNQVFVVGLNPGTSSHYPSGAVWYGFTGDTQTTDLDVCTPDSLTFDNQNAGGGSGSGVCCFCPNEGMVGGPPDGSCIGTDGSVTLTPDA